MFKTLASDLRRMGFVDADVLQVENLWISEVPFSFPLPHLKTPPTTASRLPFSPQHLVGLAWDHSPGPTTPRQDGLAPDLVPNPLPSCPSSPSPPTR